MNSLKTTDLFNVSGKIVLVTGGSRGIGKMIAAGFVANGAKVYISARSKQACSATAAELTSLGPGICISIPADLSKLQEVERLAEELARKEKMLHVLVNNAGATWGDGIDKHPDTAFTKVITLNLQHLFALTQRLLPLLRAAALHGGKEFEAHNDPARIINIGSVEGLTVPHHETYAYAASKAALHHLSRLFAGRLGWEGINSNTIACGPFPSKMTAVVIKTEADFLIGKNPSQRVGTTEDVAGTALFLASRAGAYVNGATITLDGGSVVAMPRPSKL